MINYIWGVFILLGVIISIIKGDNNLTNNLITSGTKGIDIIINLVPLMCLWLGTMKIADSSGLLNIISNKLCYKFGTQRSMTLKKASSLAEMR